MDNQQRKYRVAVVGGAGMWGRHYLQTFAERKDCDVILVDSSKERAEQFAAEFGIVDILGSLDELLKREVPDIVANILPVQLSFEAVISCAEAGVKVVSCEKPMAVELKQADEMVRVCEERGTAFGCATAHWEVPHLRAAAEWLRDGNFGSILAASIPGGLPIEVSGAGCVQLTQLRLATGMEAVWVEGSVLPAEKGWGLPDGAAEHEVDCPAYGRIGLSGDIICEIPEPIHGAHVPCRIWLKYEKGQVWLNGPQPVFIEGHGGASTPVYPEFLREEPESVFVGVCNRLIDAADRNDGTIPCSGYDYRQALEIAIALKLSARKSHRQVALPLEDRSLRIFPHDYRLRGGDLAGWESIGYAGPPPVKGHVKLNRPRKKS